MNRIYLDYAATTPLDSRVLEIIIPLLKDNFGNPSSVHAYGQQADAVLERARRKMAEDLEASPGEIIFTSCGSESDNLALRGTAFAARQDRGADHLLISPIEHPAVLHTAEQLERWYGFELEFLPVDRFGMVHPEAVRERLRPRTALVSVMYAQNEIGTLNPITEIGEICRQAGVVCHTDAVQAGAHLVLDMEQLPVDLLSLGAHKFYGPKGVGLLYRRKGTPVLAQQTGGSQEFGLRAATENVPLIAGMAEAYHLLQENIPDRASRARSLRDEMISRVLDKIPAVRLTGHPRQRLPNHASFAFRDLDGNTLVSLLDSEAIACSSGSACKTGQPEPSATLEKLGLSSRWTKGSLRVTVGKDTTADEVGALLEILPRLVAKARELS